MQGGQTRRPGGWSRTIVATLVVLMLSAAAAEIAARALFGFVTLQYRWSYHPIFVSGDYHYLVPNDELPFVREGPVAMGYRPRALGFHYDPQPPMPRSETSLTDFLFGHNRARYSAAEVDRISCSQKEAVLVHVLGGSLAQGFSATDKQSTWHARLEAMLRERLGRQDVYLFNAAMGAFISFQERLAYHLAVAPRRASLVLIVDGYNDATLSASSGVRPGDPIQLGLRYSQMFGNGFVWWLARHSAIVNRLIENEFTEHVMRFRQQLDRDDALFADYANAIADLYIENLSDVLASCEGRGQACLVGLQPARALTARHLGLGGDDVLSQGRIVQLYRALQDRIASSRFRERFIDLTHVFDDGDRLGYYSDTVHPNNDGQLVLARALLEPVAAALRTAPSVAPPIDRCTKRP